MNDLSLEKKIFPKEKNELHSRNKHRERYDFDALCKTYPLLSSFVSLNKFGDKSINFSDSNAVKALNKALLKHFYHIENWDIPANYLCPPIPGRADYIHYMADLLASSNNGIIPEGKEVKVLDIGVGANCVYPIIGNSEYGWSFIGADINPIAIESAKKIIDSNTHLQQNIEIRLQTNSNHFFKGIIQPNDKIAFTICNPPFHASLAEVEASSKRKWTGLGKNQNNKTKLNFGGQNAELWCNGGEAKFITEMIKESVLFPDNCKWFSTLVSKQDNLKIIYKTLKQVNAKTVKTIEMSQGQKISRIVAWCF